QEIADQIITRHGSDKEIVLIGIRTGGAFLAARLQKALAESGALNPLLGILDITLYRDDWTRIGSTPVVGKTDLPFSVDGKSLILVDDVLYTGRTVRAAMDALMDYGRPKKIELAILADRGAEYRELPIAPDYKGGTWATSSEETINVYLEEEGFEDHVAIEKKKAA
ncbi:MAG TPA: bifunctional pyr operon transcriptional regulator/uracil phosphoribosyltransferase PyrR, partial [Desulfobacteria bacterium]|nr:bifunctional pyr operon transcriptional regulator/uracil phosphoribosyltransferase PyrR [Desulfobacteria bacterium]